MREKLLKRLLNWFTVIATLAGTVSQVLMPFPALAVATNFTLQGYNIPTTGGFSPGWTGGNLGKSYDEGEWVPYQFSVTHIQDNYPNMTGLSDIVITFDFTGGGGARFVDLVRDIQAGTTILNDSQGFPSANGSSYR